MEIEERKSRMTERNAAMNSVKSHFLSAPIIITMIMAMTLVVVGGIAHMASSRSREGFSELDLLEVRISRLFW